MCIGLVLAAVALPLIWLAFGNLRLTLAVSVAIFFAGQ